MLSSGDCIEKFGFRLRCVPFAFLVGLAEELGVAPIAESNRFFVVVPVVLVPGNPFGFVLGVNPGLVACSLSQL
jgi:hypothetical protein